MWEAGTGVTGDGSNGFANSVDALDMYGLTAPTFKLSETMPINLKLVLPASCHTLKLVRICHLETA